ncbi:MAG TPA: hypothetical protein ENJ44_06545, partial [Oceanospirillales bacterium]|nr:hypothetical protein [Oceanospirillales bacterium]
MNNDYHLHLVAVVEQGYLQQQLKLLILSVEQFVMPHMRVKIIACCPRKGKGVTKPFIDFLSQHNVDYIDEPLNEKYAYFPLCNGIFASDYVARTYKNINALLLVDTDTLFFNPISMDLLNASNIHMRPVDNKGIGSLGDKDPNNDFWNRVFDFFNISPAYKKITTTVSQEKIRPYYNSGFVLVNKGIDFMQQWKQDFIKLMDSDIRTAASSSRHLVDYGFIEQMVLSVSSEKMNPQTLILPETYNYPIPFRPRIKERQAHPSFAELVHVH